MRNYILPIIKNIKSSLQEEQKQWFLWLPVFYGIGILIYFSIPNLFNQKINILISILLLLQIFLFKKEKYLFYIFIISFLISVGFLGAGIRSIYVQSPAIKEESNIVQVIGRIVTIETYKTGNRVILDNLTIDGITKKETPKKVRIVVFTALHEAKPGDIVSIRAKLLPPPKPVLPGAYDFSRYAYFEQIGAVGFAVSDILLIHQSYNSFYERISRIRNQISLKLKDQIKGQEAEIAKALFIGDAGGIKQNIMEDIRNSGLAHLLSISGLHLALVCFLFFASSRYLLALIPGISLRYNTKRLAAIIALIGSYLYLLMSGNPIPAQRAFIMSGMALFAIIIGRSGSPMRLVAIAATTVLVFTPENILSPSFQMSFAAVIALIAAFDFLKTYLAEKQAVNKYNKILSYLINTTISSIVAGLATAPFAVYHFSRMSPYGILANLLAIPTTSIIVMPLGVISVLLMPFNLDWLVAPMLKISIDIIIQIANMVAALPMANSLIPAINNWQIITISFSFLWLCLWRGKIRVIGGGVIILTSFCVIFNTYPDVIINSDAKFFAVKNENDELLFSGNYGSRYAKEAWITRIGQEEIKTIEKSDSKMINCDLVGCVYIKNPYRLVIIKHPIGLERDCTQDVIFINITGIKYNCAIAKKQVTLYELKEKGTHEFYLTQKLVVRTVSE